MNKNNIKNSELSDTLYAKGMVSWEQEDNQSVFNYSNWQADLLAPHLGRKIIEIGAGQGRITSVLTQKIIFERYLAQEPSPVFFEKLTQECPTIETSHAPVEELCMSLSRCFDTVISVHTLEHIENDIQFLKNLSKLLIPKGKIVLLVPALQFLMSELDYNIGHYRRYNKKMIQKIAKDLNFDILTCHYDNFIGIFGWLWFCKIRKVHYQTHEKKRKFVTILNIYDKFILPIFSAFERIIHPPVGLNLLVVLSPRDDSLKSD